MFCSLCGITRMYIDVLEKCATFLDHPVESLRSPPSTPRLSICLLTTPPWLLILWLTSDPIRRYLRYYYAHSGSWDDDFVYPATLC